MNGHLWANFSVKHDRSVRVIIDTDAKNEADDQYAITHALLSPKLDVKAVVAAHFGTRRTNRSMVESHEEILRILSLLGLSDSLARKGAFGPEDAKPSEGARTIIEEADKNDKRPLLVLCMGALTDMAQVCRLRPDLAGVPTIVWIGGGIPFEPNMQNDIEAVRCVMASQFTLFQVPRSQYMRMIVPLSVLQEKVAPCGPIGDYLFTELTAYANRPGGNRSGEHWILGDNPAVGIALCEDVGLWHEEPAPRLDFETQRVVGVHLDHTIRIYDWLDTHFILDDFFSKLHLFATHAKA